MAEHHCHAIGCDKKVPPARFSCRAHWYVLPQWLRNALWAVYRPGQEIDKRPTKIYILIQRRCVYEIAHREGRPEAAQVASEIGTLFKSAMAADSPDQQADDQTVISALDEALKVRFR